VALTASIIGGRRFSSPRGALLEPVHRGYPGCGVAIGPHALHSLALATFALRIDLLQ